MLREPGPSGPRGCNETHRSVAVLEPWARWLASCAATPRLSTCTIPAICRPPSWRHALKRVPVAVHLHLPPPFRQPRWLNHLIRKADAVITPSADTAERWVRVAGLSGSRVSVIPTGIDTDRFAPIAEADRDEQRRALGIDADVPMILYAGRVDRTKGLTHLLEARRRMEERANLVVCGAGADAGFVDTLHRESRGMDVTWVDRRLDVTSLLAAADLVVLPSLAPETQGMVVIEAMSCGTPAVATAVGGSPRRWSHFRTTSCLPAMRRPWPEPSIGWSAGAGTPRRWETTHAGGWRIISPWSGPSGRCPRCWPSSGDEQSSVWPAPIGLAEGSEEGATCREVEQRGRGGQCRLGRGPRRRSCHASPHLNAAVRHRRTVGPVDPDLA